MFRFALSRDPQTRFDWLKNKQQNIIDRQMVATVTYRSQEPATDPSTLGVQTKQSIPRKRRANFMLSSLEQLGY